MKVSTFLKPLSFIPALLLMYMIYTFSAQEGELSSSLSYKVSYKIVETADKVIDAGLTTEQISNWAVRINGVTRKVAHMSEYFLLAIAVAFPLYVYGVRGFLLMIVAGLVCVAYAAGDEYHQTFVTDRSGQLRDVGIDSIGIFFGILVVRAVGWTTRRTVFRESYEAEQVRRERKRLRRERRKLRREQQMYADERDRYDEHYPQSRARYNDQVDGRYDEHSAQSRARYEDPRDDRYDERSMQGRARYDDPRDDRYGDQYEERYDGERYRRGEESSDELSDDMPLSRLFNKKPKN